MNLYYKSKVVGNLADNKSTSIKDSGFLKIMVFILVYFYQ